ncbi:7137_t:CDS:1, partial [Scutellospora calospora]
MVEPKAVTTIEWNNDKLYINVIIYSQLFSILVAGCVITWITSTQRSDRISLFLILGFIAWITCTTQR